MKFLRDSLTKKALLFFTLLMGALVGTAIFLVRKNITTLPVNLFLGILAGLIFLILLLFLYDVVWPMSRVARQIRYLFSGKYYQRLEPVTIDEIGMFTHFFNEITKDLEKISYDVRERRRMSSELDIASQIQRDVLPKEAPDIQGFDIVAKTRPAAEVGGDSFDFLLSPDKQQNYIYIGDVTGHGVPSGLIMVMANTLIHSMISMGMTNSRDILVSTNTLLTPRISSRLFMTLVMLRWNPVQEKLYYTGAGHEHILVYRAATDKVEALRSGGIALGMIPDNSKILEEKEIPLAVGDSIVLYTDGLTEAKNSSGEMYGLERLTKSFLKYGYLPSSEGIFDRLTKDFAGFVGEYVQTDDITVIVMKYAGKSAVTKTKLMISEETQIQKTGVWSWD